MTDIQFDVEKGRAGEEGRGQVGNKLEINKATSNEVTLAQDMPKNETRYLSVPQKAESIIINKDEEKEKDIIFDPWALPEFNIETVDWKDLTLAQKLHKIFIEYIGKFLILLTLLYFFICSLDLLSSSFRLLGGKAAGKVFQENKLLNNNIAGLMIGVLVTVLLQSSSTTTSIIVTMVASGILQVKQAIPIIMGANVGTSITNTIVSIAQSGDKNEFRRAFAAATLHDMFNWLTVFVLLPIESLTGFLFQITESIVKHFKIGQMKDDSNKEILSKLTKPFTSLFIVLDKEAIKMVAEGKFNSTTTISLIQRWCPSKKQSFAIENAHTILPYESNADIKNATQLYGAIPNTTNLLDQLTEDSSTMTTVAVGFSSHLVKCKSLFSVLHWSDAIVGTILLVFSLCLLCLCLIGIVKVLHSMLKGKIAVAIRKTVNSDFPWPFGFLTGYVAILIGAGVTFMVQSSSIFTSALTPLVGIGVVTLDRVYPLTLGSNLGTTATGILASLTASSDMLKYSLQIALCHLFFNLFGILLWYPIPFTRFPIYLAKILGDTTAKYRWFAALYLIVAFFIIPGTVFAISSLATTLLPNNNNASSFLIFTIFGAAAILIILIFLINLLQRKRPLWLPNILRTWSFLPQCMHSLKPLNDILVSFRSSLNLARFKLFSKKGAESTSSGSATPPNVLSQGSGGTKNNSSFGKGKGHKSNGLTLGLNDTFSSTNALLKTASHNSSSSSFVLPPPQNHNSNNSSVVVVVKESPVPNRTFATRGKNDGTPTPLPTFGTRM